MSKKCPGCGKTVYFAERQVKDGVDWHGNCLIRHVQDQKKGAQASNPFQSYRTGASPSASRHKDFAANSRGSLELSSPSQPTGTASPPRTEERSPEPVISNISHSPEPDVPSKSPELREEKRKLSNPQLSKVEEFIQNASLSKSIEAEPVEEPEAEDTGFCSNCGEPRGTDGAKFCSNCGEAF